MNVKTIILATTITSIGFAQLPTMPEPQPEQRVENAYTYLNLHLLGLGLGFRKQVGHHGIDAGAGFQTALIMSSARAYVNYLIFPDPSPVMQAYFGLGICGSTSATFAFDAPGDSGRAIGANFAFGTEKHRSDGGRSFWQLDIGFPNYDFDKKGVGTPAIYLTHGIGF